MQRISLTPRPAPARHVPPPSSAGLGWALRTVLRDYLARADAVLATAPGGQHGYEILAAVSAGDYGTQISLANRLGIHRTVVTDRIDDLERAGMLQRHLSAADRRVRRLVITDAGRAVLTELSAGLEAAEEETLASLDEDDRERFLNALHLLARRPVVAA